MLDNMIKNSIRYYMFAEITIEAFKKLSVHGHGQVSKKPSHVQFGQKE
jgi:hypothetical protein